ncbi:uncharacterized protein LOC122091608 [Macadamia integrifolia]|uniref:uncharacterized protein LOC122091608 n=1 Tax=Macadamia integrifolia TaxID=60698 RepID=UPI001C4EA8DC|nr:uncharacterized protein LOC122091608 [Macadamia integrifolia]
MQCFANQKWQHVGAVEVFGPESGIFIFDFQSVEACRQILDEGPWSLGARPLILHPWSPEISLTKKVEKFLPLWIRLYGLNLHFWGNRSLGKIASVLGTPICVDRRTAQRERLSFARLCVLMNAEGGLPSTVHIVLDDGSTIEQPVVYDWVPPICSTCKTFGHNDHQCKVEGSEKNDERGGPLKANDQWQEPQRRQSRGRRPASRNNEAFNDAGRSSSDTNGGSDARQPAQGGRRRRISNKKVSWADENTATIGDLPI